VKYKILCQMSILTSTTDHVLHPVYLVQVTGISKIIGPDGKPFMDGLQRSNSRLAWNLSVNWFNLHGNKTARKKKSIGSITMVLLNLPSSLWYKAENIYTVGIIPGPRKPLVDKINYFLWSLIDFFLLAWQSRTWFMRTVMHQEDWLLWSVIALAVNNLSVA